MCAVLYTEIDAGAGFLEHLHDEDITTILSYTQDRRFTTGEAAALAGEQDRSLYIVASGSFAVLVASVDGPRQIALLQPGDMFGELAFFDNQPRSADVRAMEESEALVMTPAAFERLRLSHSRLALCFVLELGRILSVRFREKEKRLNELERA